MEFTYGADDGIRHVLAQSRAKPLRPQAARGLCRSSTGLAHLADVHAQLGRAGFGAVSVGAVLAGGLLVALAGAGCSDSSPSTGVGHAGGEPEGGSGGDIGGSPVSLSPVTRPPMRVIVQSDKSLQVNAGQGVAVIVEYQAGGHWNISWTCDTLKTNVSCSFDVIASVASGTIALLACQGIDPTCDINQEGDQTLQEGSQQVEALTGTSTEVDGMMFDTPLGATAPVITVQATVNGTESGSFFFFMQDNEINGGYTHTLTDPLQFEPSSP